MNWGVGGPWVCCCDLASAWRGRLAGVIPFAEETWLLRVGPWPSAGVQANGIQWTQPGKTPIKFSERRRNNFHCVRGGSRQMTRARSKQTTKLMVMDWCWQLPMASTSWLHLYPEEECQLSRHFPFCIFLLPNKCMHNMNHSLSAVSQGHEPSVQPEQGGAAPNGPVQDSVSQGFLMLPVYGKPIGSCAGRHAGALQSSGGQVP